ncbi:hypothetical protein JCM11491_000736 [Sporobolomyces phaffii]
MPFSPASRLARLALALALGARIVSAHVELLFPPPINSKYDPQTIEANIDYSMTSPLADDGSNFPCKGYNTPEAYSSLKPVATLQAGTDFEIEFAPGGATHGGGSCQFSISYDQGKTFAVLYSVEGGCPLTSNYKVPIPSDLPSATSATFAWTWFNKVGNREMYMNCAIVDVAGSKATSFTGPELYKANVFEDGTCRTVEGVEPVFPNPGPTEYGGSTTSASPVTPLDNCALKQDGDVTVSPSSSGSTPSKPTPASSSRSSVASSTTSSKNFNPLPSTSPAPAPAPSTPAQSKRPTFKDRTAAASPSSSSVTNPSPKTTSVASSSLVWHKVSTASQTPSPSSSSSSSPIPSSSPAPGSSASPTSLQAAVTRPPYVRKTTGAPIRTPVRVTTTYTRTAVTTSTATATTTTTVTSSACSTADVAAPTATSSDSPGDGSGDDNDGEGGGGGGSFLRCDTLVTFSLCDANGCTPMGAVAPGTQCRDGRIQLAAAQRLIKVRRGAVVGVPLRGGGGPATSNLARSPALVRRRTPEVNARHQPWRHSS